MVSHLMTLRRGAGRGSANARPPDGPLWTTRLTQYLDLHHEPGLPGAGIDP